ncbi:MAG TPA: MFS transporter [Acidimicrobiales bacterium]|nr:MFS transporter [Acidimicrobiales bacterium]
MSHADVLPLHADPHVHARRWRTLGVLCLSLTIVMIANLSLNLALPSIARDLEAGTGALQWMVDAYALVFAGLLFCAGTLGDRYGRKGALQVGLVLFLVGSGIALLAQTAAVVIVARVVMGVAAAFVMPSTLSIISNVFAPEERGRAIAVWAGVAAGGAALGPVASGLLLEHFWWGSVFLINVPLALAALVAGRWLVPTSRDPEQRPLDVPGALLSIVGIGALVFAIIEAPEVGWAARETLAGLAVAVAGLGLFVRRELTARHPMLDLALFRDRRFGVATTGIGLTYFTLFGSFFLVAQFLQLVLGLSPFQAGLVQMPVSLTMLVVAPQVPRFVDRHGPRAVIATGLLLVAVGMAAATRLDEGTPAVMAAVALVPTAVGIAATGAPLTALMMAAVPPSRAGMGSAMNNASREVGGALGVAILGTVLSTRYGAALAPALVGLPAERAAIADGGLAGALDVARDLPAAAGARLADAGRAAFVEGFSAAAGAAAALAVAVAMGAWLLLPRREEEPGAGAGTVADEVLDLRDADAGGDGDVGVVGAGLSD